MGGGGVSVTQGTESVLRKWCFYLCNYDQFIASVGPVDTHDVRRAGAQPSCWQQFLAQTELGIGRLWRLCLPDCSFCVPKPQDCSVTAAFRRLTHEPLPAGHRARRPHCRPYLSPPVYLQTRPVWLFLPMAYCDCSRRVHPGAPWCQGQRALFHLVPVLTSSLLKHSLLFASYLKNPPPWFSSHLSESSVHVFSWVLSSL